MQHTRSPSFLSSPPRSSTHLYCQITKQIVFALTHPPRLLFPLFMNRSHPGKKAFCTLLSQKRTKIAPKYANMFFKLHFKSPPQKQIYRCLWFTDDTPLLYTYILHYLLLEERIEEEMLAWRELLTSFSGTETSMSECAGTSGSGSSEVKQLGITTERDG